MSQEPAGMISVEKFSKIKGISETKIIQMIRDGFYIGRKVGDDWFRDSDETTKDELTPYGFVKTKKKSSEATSHVIVTDVQMPFGSMVIFMVKWVIASIPAFIILFILGAVATGFLGGVLSGFS